MFVLQSGYTGKNSGSGLIDFFEILIIVFIGMQSVADIGIWLLEVKRWNHEKD